MGAKVKVTSRLDDIARRALDQSDDTVREVAERVARGAKGRAPRRTGSLAESIATEQDGPMKYYVTADFPWYLLEHGTARAGARPFMVPAAEAERDNLKRAVSDLFKP